MRKELRDKNGYIEGYIEDDGTITDKHGYFKGRVDSEGRITDNHGFYKGNVDSQGRVTDHHGYSVGRNDENGMFFSTDGTARDHFESERSTTPRRADPSSGSSYSSGRTSTGGYSQRRTSKEPEYLGGRYRLIPIDRSSGYTSVYDEDEMCEIKSEYTGKTYHWPAHFMIGGDNGKISAAERYYMSRSELTSEEKDRFIRETRIDA